MCCGLRDRGYFAEGPGDLAAYVDPMANGQQGAGGIENGDIPIAVAHKAAFLFTLAQVNKVSGDVTGIVDAFAKCK